MDQKASDNVGLDDRFLPTPSLLRRIRLDLFVDLGASLAADKTITAVFIYADRSTPPGRRAVG